MCFVRMLNFKFLFFLLLSASGHSANTCEENFKNYDIPSYAANMIHPGVLIRHYDESTAGNIMGRYMSKYQPELESISWEVAYPQLDLHAYTLFMGKDRFILLDLQEDDVIFRYHPGHISAGQGAFSFIKQTLMEKRIGSFSTAKLENFILQLQSYAVYFETMRGENVVGYRDDGESVIISKKYPCRVDELVEYIERREPEKKELAVSYFEKFFKNSFSLEKLLKMKLTKKEQQFQDEFLFICPYENAKQAFREFVKELETRIANGDDWVELAAFAHTAVAVIHPFKEANGRTARFLMNALLMSGGYAPIVFLSEREYTKAIDKVGPNFKASDFENLLVRKVNAMRDPVTSKFYQKLSELILIDNLQSTESSKTALKAHLKEMLQEKL